MYNYNEKGFDMKIERRLIIYTDTLEEQQKVLEKFPEACWIFSAGFSFVGRKCTFFLSDELSIETVRRILDGQ